MGLIGCKIHAPITGTGGEMVAISRKLVSINVQSHFESEPSYEVQALVLKKVSSYKPLSFSPKFSPVHLQRLQLADTQYLDRSHVDVLLGAALSLTRELNRSAH